ncbi:MAG: hypothetical protein J1G07_00915 [Clostridiales bacterium]|nr:hypothetical protein [Clostridiales bacterium]
MKKKPRKKLNLIRENKEILKWVIFVVQTLISAFVGTLIALIFGANYYLALITFGVLMGFLILMSIVIIVIQNQISLLSIMQKSIDDKRYEEAIQYGIAMSKVLFSSNKNHERIQLGEKINDACKKLRSKDRSNKIKINNFSLDEVQAGVLIDDLGWSMHLCNQNITAINNILRGMNIARTAASIHIRNTAPNEDANALKGYVAIILKGYRHLTGIYYENSDTLEEATYYENITKLILSSGKALKQGGPCSNSDEGHCCELPGLVCVKDGDEQKRCVLKSILALFFNEDKIENLTGHEISKYIGYTPTGDVDISDVQKDIELFSKLTYDDKMALLSEQSYAWSRNIIKKLKITRHMSLVEEYFSDNEIDCRLCEAEIYALVYYFGKQLVNNATDMTFSNYRGLIEGKEDMSTKDLRFISIINEIEMDTLSLGLSRESGEFQDEKNQRIAKVKSNLEFTMKSSETPRVDLYVRNACRLLELYLIEFNALHRYRSSHECKINAAIYLKETDRVYGELRKHANRYNEVNETYNEVKREFTHAAHISPKKVVIKDLKKVGEDKIISLLANIPSDYAKCSICENVYVSPDVEERVAKINEKWRIKS